MTGNFVYQVIHHLNGQYMVSIFNKAAQQLFGLYQKAEDLIEEEMEFPISTGTLNNVIDRFVTQKVAELDDLHVALFDGWARLYAKIHYKGIRASLSTDLKLIQFILDKDTQRMVFEQTDDTLVLDASFEKKSDKLLFNVGLWFIRHVMHKDPLSFILKKLDIITIEYDLLYLDLNKYLKDQYRFMSTLKKVQINHAVIREDKFILKANINVKGIFSFLSMDNKKPNQASETDADIPADDVS